MTLQNNNYPVLLLRLRKGQIPEKQYVAIYTVSMSFVRQITE